MPLQHRRSMPPSSSSTTSRRAAPAMAAASLPAAPSPGPAPSPAALLGPCIERIIAGASGRKYAKLRQDAQVRGGSVSAEAADVPACPAHMPSACSCTHPHAAFDMRTSTTHTRCSCVRSSHTHACSRCWTSWTRCWWCKALARRPSRRPSHPPCSLPSQCQCRRQQSRPARRSSQRPPERRRWRSACRPGRTASSS